MPSPPTCRAPGRPAASSSARPRTSGARHPGRKPRHLAGGGPPVDIDDRRALAPYGGHQSRQRVRPREARGGAYEAAPAPTATGVRGRIVLVSSTAGQRGEAFHCDYAATKGALISMTKGLSTELAHDGIYVNCVAPGWVRTDMSIPVLQDPADEARVLGTIPLGRVGTPDEIAAPVLFLCTEHANFITGEVFNVNGGAVLVG